jgi:hypothetical protein
MGDEHDMCNAPAGTPRIGLKAFALENFLIMTGKPPISSHIYANYAKL